MPNNWPDDILGKDIAVDGVIVTPRRGVANFIQGTSATISAVDNPITEMTDVTFSVPSAGGGSSIDYKDSVRAATTANIANLAAASVTQDGVTLVEGDRLLVWQQTNPAENGIYVVGVVGGGLAPLTRAADADTSAEVTSGQTVQVTQGTLYGETRFLLTTADPITLGATGLTYEIPAFSWAAVLAQGNTSGANNAIISNGQYLQVGTTTPADDGQIRLSPATSILWRNAGNTANMGISCGFDSIVVGAGSITPVNVELWASAEIVATISGTDIASFKSTGLDFAGEVSVLRQTAAILDTSGGVFTQLHAPSGGYILFLDGASTLIAGLNQGAGTGTWGFAETLNAVITVQTRTTAATGKNITLAGGGGGTGQPGGDTFVDAGAPGAGGAGSRVVVRDYAGGERIEVTTAKDTILNGLVQNSLRVDDDDIVVIDRDGTAPRMYLTDGASGTESTFFVTAVTPSGDRAGINVLERAGDANGPSSNNGGSWSIQVGAKNGGGSDGTFKVIDAASTTRIQLDASKNVMLSGNTAVEFKIGGSTICTVNATEFQAPMIVGTSSGTNLAIHAAPSGWNSMVGGIFIKNATTMPTGGDAGGGYLVVEGGALKWRGPSTLTTIAAA